MLAAVITDFELKVSEILLSLRTEISAALVFFFFTILKMKPAVNFRVLTNVAAAAAAAELVINRWIRSNN